MTILSLSLSLGMPFLLLYSRKHKWYNRNVKLLIVLGLSFTGILGFVMSDTADFRLFFYAILTTPVFILIDSLFKQLSMMKHNRDFYLWLRGSSEIDDSFSGIGSNKHVRITDKVFSIALLFLIFGMCALGAILFGNDGLYEKLIG